MIELDKEKLYHLYIEENQTQEQIAVEMGVSSDTVARALRGYNIVKPLKQRESLRTNSRPGAKIKLSYEELYNLYIIYNFSKEEVAKRFDVSLSKVKRKLREFNIHKSPELIKQQMCRDSLSKHGVEYSLQRKDVRDAILKTNYNKSEEEKLKRLQKVRATWDKNNSYWGHMSEEARKAISSAENLRNFILQNGIRTPLDLSQALNYSISKATLLIHKMGCEDLITFYFSSPEQELRDLLASWGIKTVKTRTVIAPYELDLYSEKYKIAIEFNGNYWHGENRVTPSYHKIKSEMAQKQGIFLYHIFEYEWNIPLKKELIIAQLKNLFGLNEKKIFARQCEIKSVSVIDKQKFLNDNHLQGEDRSSVAVGLYCDEELVSIMTFCKPRFNKQYDWELSRFCSKRGYNVVGGASKLFNWFLNNFSGTIISYSNEAKTRGALYEKLGFRLLRISPPNYVWCKGEECLPRYRTQMKNEVQIMKGQNYWRVYDCGNKVWVYER